MIIDKHYIAKNLISYLLIAFAFTFPLSIAAINIILALLLIAWVIEGNYKYKLNIIKNDKFIIAMFIFMFAILISIILTINYNDGFMISKDTRIIRFLWLIVFYITFITSKNKKQLINYLITAFLLSMFINEFFTISVYFDFSFVNTLKEYGIISHKAIPSDPTPRMNHSYYSVFLTTTILLLINKFTEIKNFKYKILILFFIISSTLNLFINGGRVGQITYVLSLIIFFIIKFKKDYIKIIISFIFIIATILMAYMFSSNFKHRINLAQKDILKVLEKEDYRSSWGARAGMNIVGFSYLTHDPSNFLFGAGARKAKKKYIEYGKKNYKNIIISFHHYHLHNQFLQAWMDGGIIALLAYIYLFIILLKTNTKYKELKYSFIVLFFIISITEVFIYKVNGYILFIFVLLVIKYYQNSEQESER